MATSQSLSMRTLYKFILPLMGIFMVSTLLWGNHKKAWAVFPLILIALYLSAAELRIEGKHIYYRHFFLWKRLPNDVADVRCSIFPALGYVRFRHFYPPLGLLFYVVERDSRKFIPFRRTASMESMLVSIPQIEINLHDDSIDQIGAGGNISGNADVVYVAFGVLAGVLVPVPWQHFIVPTNHSFIARVLQVQLCNVSLCFDFAILVVFIYLNRSRRLAVFGLSFLLGTIVARLCDIH